LSTAHVGEKEDRQEKVTHGSSYELTLPIFFLSGNLSDKFGSVTKEEIIKKLGLELLPEEGGYYRQTFKSKQMLPGARACSTAIYYLITPEQFSALHRVPQDEIFHFYLGDPVDMIQITPEGTLTEHVLGQEIMEGQELQVAVRGSVWQGTRLRKTGQWALLGCTVAPGFEFADFEIKSRDELALLFPQHEKQITYFTSASPSF
jgi:uncharacterized protein